MTRLTIAGVMLACASLVAGTAAAQHKASADITDTTGKTVGEAILEQRTAPCEITATFTGLPPEHHAFHIHEVGRCDRRSNRPGGHFNPTGKQHGKDNPAGLTGRPAEPRRAVGAAASRCRLTVKDVSLDGGPAGCSTATARLSSCTRAPDDHKSDPAGNAGKRLACGVIRR